MRADSLTFNPQEWMMVAKTCLLPTYRGATWLRIVRLNPYLSEGEIDAVFRDIDHYAARSSTTGLEPR